MVRCKASDLSLLSGVTGLEGLESVEEGSVEGGHLLADRVRHQGLDVVVRNRGHPRDVTVREVPGARGGTGKCPSGEGDGWGRTRRWCSGES